MTKTLRKGLLAILLAIALVCVGLAAVLFTRPASADEETGNPPDRGTPIATVNLGKTGLNNAIRKEYYYEDFIEGWAQAVALARLTAEAYDYGTEYVKVQLWGDWVAAQTKSTDTLVKYFNTTASAFGVEDCFKGSYGLMLIPSKTNIEIDLNGYKINR